MHSDRAARDGFHAVEALRQLVRLLHDSARMAQGQTGISGAQLFVLRVVAEHPGLSINELAQRTMTHQSSVSVVVSRLAVKGLVTRAPSAEDRRRQVVTLTAQGRTLYRSSPAVAQERIVAAVLELPPSKRTGLAAGLRALAGALGAGGRGASMFFEDDKRSTDTLAPERRRTRSARSRRVPKAHV